MDIIYCICAILVIYDYIEEEAMIQTFDAFLWNANLLQIAKRYNIKDAESIINKAIEANSNYAHYAQLAGTSEGWANKITKEINYRIERVNA